MTDDELYAEVARIEGLVYNDPWFVHLDPRIVIEPEYFCFRLIEKYQLEIEWDYVDREWGICRWSKEGAVSFNTLEELATNEDLKTAICLAVKELNKSDK